MMEEKMESVSIREFYEKYAEKQDKRNIRWSAIFACVCAAISLVSGLFMHNYLIVIDVALVVGLALGVQIAKSRVCALLIVIYAAFNTISTLVSTGKVTGSWLILVGIWAWTGTYRLHQSYRKYLSESETQNQIQE